MQKKADRWSSIHTCVALVDNGLPIPGATQLRKQNSIATQHGNLGIADPKNPFFSFTIISYLPVATPGLILTNHTYRITN